MDDMVLSRFNRHIHLLYVPTISCNLGCRYCYLGGQTDRKGLGVDAGRAAQTLEYGLKSFLDAGVLPFNVSLHGGEPTMLPMSVLDKLFCTISSHYMNHYDELNARGYRKSSPHIKTNLFNYHKLVGLFDRHRVSISASIDLPLRMHGELRTTRQGKSWLNQTLTNLGLLAAYPHTKKISSTLYMEHLEYIDAIIEDIVMIHEKIGFDMNCFNIMFGFASRLNRQRFGKGVHGATEQKQLELYERLKEKFTGTCLEEGFRRNWFDEFKPSYCTNAFNCGERFFLLQSDGSVWSCVRGQGLQECYYGNIFTDKLQQILDAGRNRIELLHQKNGMDKGCLECEHIHRCHTGCPVVKMHTGSGRSYTCGLQKAIYRDNPVSYPPASSYEQQKTLAWEYVSGMHPSYLYAGGKGLLRPPARKGILLPADMNQKKNHLLEVITSDPLLVALYSDDSVYLEIGEETERLQSQILKGGRQFWFMGPDDRIVVHIRCAMFDANCNEPVQNSLHLQMLRDTPVVYGDEQRTKQEHLFTHQIFNNMLAESRLMGRDFVEADISGLLLMHRNLFIKGVLNNLFVTTTRLREYHYQKQRNNAFYHIQAINLPFHNIEFYWIEE